MKPMLKNTLTLAALALATPAFAQVTFYERDGFQGGSFTTQRPVANFDRYGFNDRASSVTVARERWEVCQDVRFTGRCVVLRPGRYPSLAAMGLDDRISSMRAVSRNARVAESRYAPAPEPLVAAPVASVTFYENEGFQGRSFTTAQPVLNFGRSGFNDRASSVQVLGERWEVCEDTRFSGRCVVLRPGRYASLGAMGLNDRISSVRAVSREARVEDGRYAPLPGTAPPPAAVYDNQRRQGERLYEASVTSVRAVVGPPQQRCWIERGQAASPGGNNSGVPGAIAGALIGGILGHQVGGGTGKDIATAGGAVAGAALGANLSRDGRTPQAAVPDVQRCETVPNQASPHYWDVTYTFRGQEHRVQMTAPPGPTVTVNLQGEPRP